VEKNPQYWDAAVVKLKEIHFFPIDNYETEERVFLDNQLHVTYTVPLAKVPLYRAKEPRDPFFNSPSNCQWSFTRSTRSAKR
jgi:oligopeptide transport system substrate-binding protein